LHLLDLLHSVALLREEQHPQCPQQHRTLSAAPIELSYKSRAATVMGGAITAVAVIITDGVEVAAIIMVGGITVIGGDLQLRPILKRRLRERPLFKSRFRCRRLAQMRSADGAEQCPVLRVKPKTYARTEFFSV
jgi:hypothetical protein